jgi:molybdate transport system permease protein
MILPAIALSLIMGVAAVVLCLIPGLAVAWLLARGRFRGKLLLEAASLLPLVIPPVVTGYLIIALLGANSWIGRNLLAPLGIHVVFTRLGMALAAAVMGFPLFVKTTRVALENVAPELEWAARTLGCSALRTFFQVTLPLSWPGMMAGAVLAFARALGEFGATAMVSPGIEGYRTISLEIFRSYQIPGQEPRVMLLAGVSIAMSLAALALSEPLAQRYSARQERETRAAPNERPERKYDPA